MIKRNIRTLLALGVAFVSLIITSAKANWHETSEQQDGLNYYLQVKKGGQLNSFNYFYCDKNPNATLGSFHERPYSQASVESLGLPGSPDHIVHQFGKELLIIPGNTYQSKMVCRPESQKKSFYKKVVISKKACPLEEKEETLLTKVKKLFESQGTLELEEALRRQFWMEIVRASDEMVAGSNTGSGEVKNDGQGSVHDFRWQESFPKGGGSSGGNQGRADNDNPDNIDDDLKDPLFVPVKSFGSYFDEYGFLGFPESKPKEKKKKRSRNKVNLIVTPSAPFANNIDSSSATVEITANTVVENLTTIQFALLMGGFEINDDLQQQLMHLNELSPAELEQLAEGFSETISNLDSLTENGTIQTPGISSLQLVQLLTKIEALIRELMAIKDSLADSQQDPNLKRIRENLQQLVTGNLISAILGSNEVVVSDNISQNDLLVHALLDAGIDDKPQTVEAGKEELEDLRDEYIRRIQSGITGEDLIRALVKKIEAIQRQIDRRKANLSVAQGSWLEALKNRLGSLRLELEAAEQSLGNVIHNYFDTPCFFAQYVTDVTPDSLAGESRGEPVDSDNPQDKNPKTFDKSKLNQGASDSSGVPGSPSKDSEDDDTNESDRSGGDGRRRDDRRDGGDDRHLDDHEKEEPLSEEQLKVLTRDMSAWFAERLKVYSAAEVDMLPVYATGLATILESTLTGETIQQIQDLIKKAFEKNYPYFSSYLTPQEKESEFAAALSAMMRVMRPAALAHFLTEVLTLKEMRNVRTQFNRSVGGRGLSRQDTLHNPNSQMIPVVRPHHRHHGLWEVEVEHDGQDLLASRELQDSFQRQLQRLSIHQVIAGDEDGVIRFTPEQVQNYRGGTRDSVRTPITIEYARLVNPLDMSAAPHAGVGAELVSDRRYPIFDSKEVERVMNGRYKDSQRVAINSQGDLDFSEAQQANSEAIDTSRRGGVEDALQLLFQEHREVETLFHFLLSQNTGNMARILFFGGYDEEKRKVNGLLADTGHGTLSPTNSRQDDNSTQNIKVTVYSDGRISFRYHVSFDRVIVIKETMIGRPNKFNANFNIDLRLEFETKEGLRNTYSEIKYYGESPQSSLFKREISAIKGDEKAKDLEHLKNLKQKIIEAINIFKDLEFYTGYEAECRQVKGYFDVLRIALNKYQEALRIFSLYSDKQFLAARTALEHVEPGEKPLAERLHEQLEKFLWLEKTSYEVLRPRSHELTAADSSVSEMFHLYDDFRERLLEKLNKLNWLKKCHQSSDESEIAELTSLRNELVILVERVEEQGVEYEKDGCLWEQRRKMNFALDKRRKESGDSQADSESFNKHHKWFDLFVTNTVVLQGILFESRLLLDQVRRDEKRKEQQIERRRQESTTPAPTYGGEMSRSLGRIKRLSKSTSNLLDNKQLRVRGAGITTPKAKTDSRGHSPSFFSKLTALGSKLLAGSMRSAGTAKTGSSATASIDHLDDTIYQGSSGADLNEAGLSSLGSEVSAASGNTQGSTLDIFSGGTMVLPLGRAQSARLNQLISREDYEGVNEMLFSGGHHPQTSYVIWEPGTVTSPLYGDYFSMDLHSRQQSTELNALSPPPGAWSGAVCHQKSYSADNTQLHTLQTPIRSRQCQKQNSWSSKYYQAPQSPMNPSKHDYATIIWSADELTAFEGQSVDIYKSFSNGSLQEQQFQALMTPRGDFSRNLLQVISEQMVSDGITPKSLAHKLLLVGDPQYQYSENPHDLTGIDLVLRVYMAVPNLITNLVEELRVIFGKSFDTKLTSAYHDHQRRLELQAEISIINPE